MAAVAPPLRLDSLEGKRSGKDLRFGIVLVSGLTLFALAVHGYHPYTEDGGLYLAGARHLLDPSLYPHDTAFVSAPTRFSLFAPFIAGLVRLTGLPGTQGLATVVFVLHLATVWGTLASAWLLASCCWTERSARAGSVLLLACWLSVPVAGTSLLLMDPYLTARSFSTPLFVLALAGVLMATPRAASARERRNGFVLWSASILAAAAMHPLMAAYALGASILVAWIRQTKGRTRWAGLAGIGLTALAGAALLQSFARAVPPGYTQIALSRPYWFLESWRWFELAGVVLPALLLAWFARPTAQTSAGQIEPPRALAAAALAGILLATAVSVFFVRPGGPKYLIAQLQPMREMQCSYLIMILLLGAWLGRSFLARRPARWIAAALVLAAPLLAAARAATPGSRQVELPWLAPVNPWVRAFVWVRGNTPKDALFALYPDYVSAPSEGAQCFRAIAERSVLADYSKDGGEASIDPQLTPAWLAGQAAQRGLATEPDSVRQRKLRPLGVSWVILGADVPTGFSCPYRNRTVKVCRLR